jgi:hypothetical protein
MSKPAKSLATAVKKRERMPLPEKQESAQPKPSKRRTEGQRVSLPVKLQIINALTAARSKTTGRVFHEFNNKNISETEKCIIAYEKDSSNCSGYKLLVRIPKNVAEPAKAAAKKAAEAAAENAATVADAFLAAAEAAKTGITEATKKVAEAAALKAEFFAMEAKAAADLAAAVAADASYTEAEKKAAKKAADKAKAAADKAKADADTAEAAAEEAKDVVAHAEEGDPFKVPASPPTIPEGRMPLLNQKKEANDANQAAKEAVAKAAEENGRFYLCYKPRTDEGEYARVNSLKLSHIEYDITNHITQMNGLVYDKSKVKVYRIDFPHEPLNDQEIRLDKKVDIKFINLDDIKIEERKFEDLNISRLILAYIAKKPPTSSNKDDPFNKFRMSKGKFDRTLLKEIKEKTTDDKQLQDAIDAKLETLAGGKRRSKKGKKAARKASKKAGKKGKKGRKGSKKGNRGKKASKHRRRA